MCNQGFIKLSRKFFETPLWKEPRQYSRSEAWLDLIQMAGFEDSKYILNNREIEVRRGEIVASRRVLENWWNFGSKKLSNFIYYLKANRMINQRQTSGQTIITLCNYDIYNDKQTKSRERNKPPCKPDTNQTQTTDKPATNQNKESKEGKENNIPPLPSNEGIPPVDNPGALKKKLEAAQAAALKRKEEFYNSLVPHVERYGKEMIRAFFDYWSEFNKSQTRMRFELQKTWELTLRLINWERKEKVAPKRKSNFANLNNEQRYEDF